MKKLLRKIISLSLITLTLSTLSITTAYGATNDEYLRVRVRSPRLYNEQAALSGYNEINVYELSNGVIDIKEILTLEDSNVSVLLDSYFDKNYNYSGNANNASYGPHHVVINEEYSSYDDANEQVKKLENKYNADFYAQYSKDGYKIYGGNYTNNTDANNLLAELNSNGYNGQTVNTNMENVLVYDANDNVVFMYSNDCNIYFSSYNKDEASNMIKIDNRAYRGYLGFNVIESSKLISINYVDLENYLYGVVPNEISASWGMESLKSQAVAARTYAVSCLNPKAASGYDLEDNQNSQVYRGVVSEHKATNQAVDETKGEMIYYNDKLIQAFYHSTSGGSTENSENVWTAKLPYAVGVEDEFTNRSNSPYNEWQKSYDKNEIIKKLRDDGNNVSDLYSIEITKVSENNRVMECIFFTDIGEIVYKKENARLLLGLMSSWFKIETGSVFYFTNENTLGKTSNTTSQGGILDSITEGTENSTTKNKLTSGSFSGKYTISSTGTKKLSQDKLAVISSSGISVIDTTSSKYNFEGRGWGHGIGMSQYGAKQMAAEGYTYEEILKHYYTGVTIK